MCKPAWECGQQELDGGWDVELAIGCCSSLLPAAASATSASQMTSGPTPVAVLCPSLFAHTGTRGTPWRLEVDKNSGVVTTTAFSNFSKGLLPPGSAAALRASNGAVYAPLSTVAGGSGAAVAAPPAAGGVQLQAVDYSSQALSGEDAQVYRFPAGCGVRQLQQVQLGG